MYIEILRFVLPTKSLKLKKVGKFQFWSDLIKRKMDGMINSSCDWSKPLKNNQHIKYAGVISDDMPNE